MMEELLRMEGISKQFGEFYANRNVNFDVRAGEVHTLLGENGAGKSTLMNVLIGLYQPTAGDIYLHGQKVKIESPAQAVKLGVGMVHQHFMGINVIRQKYIACILCGFFAGMRSFPPMMTTLILVLLQLLPNRE